MLDPGLFAAFVVAVTLLVLTPGPDMLFIVAVGARGGPTVGFAAAIGVAAGLAVHATAFGLAALFVAVPTLYVVVKVLGAAYLFYLGVTTLLNRNEPLVAENDQPAGGRPLRAFSRGLLTNLLNPKVVLFNAAFLPQFVDPQRGSVTAQLLVLGAVFVLVDLLIDGPVGLIAGRFGVALAKRRAAMRRLNIATGSIFIGLSARLALTR